MRLTKAHIAVAALAALVAGAFALKPPPTPPVRREAEPLRPMLVSLSELHTAAQTDRTKVDAYLSARARAVETADVDALIVASRDEDLAVRVMAIHLLGAVGGERAMAALMHAYRAGDAQAAAQAVAAIEGADAVPALLEILSAGPAANIAAEALGRRGDARAVEPLIAALRDETDPSRACHAAGALARLGGPAARLALEQSAAGATHVSIRRSAQQASTRFSEEPR